MNSFINRFGYPLKYLMAIKGLGVCRTGVKILGLVPLLRRPTDPTLL